MNTTIGDCLFISLSLVLSLIWLVWLIALGGILYLLTLRPKYYLPPMPNGSMKDGGMAHQDHPILRQARTLYRRDQQNKTTQSDCSGSG